MVLVSADAGVGTSGRAPSFPAPFPLLRCIGFLPLKSDVVRVRALSKSPLRGPVRRRWIMKMAAAPTRAAPPATMPIVIVVHPPTAATLCAGALQVVITDMLPSRVQLPIELTATKAAQQDCLRAAQRAGMP